MSGFFLQSVANWWHMHVGVCNVMVRAAKNTCKTWYSWQRQTFENNWNKNAHAFRDKCYEEYGANAKCQAAKVEGDGKLENVDEDEGEKTDEELLQMMKERAEKEGKVEEHRCTTDDDVKEICDNKHKTYHEAKEEYVRKLQRHGLNKWPRMSMWTGKGMEFKWECELPNKRNLPHLTDYDQPCTQWFEESVLNHTRKSHMLNKPLTPQKQANLHWKLSENKPTFTPESCTGEQASPWDNCHTTGVVSGDFDPEGDIVSDFKKCGNFLDGC